MHDQALWLICFCQRVLEMRLTHSLHTIALLKSAISKERYGLAMDVSQLDELKRNARSEDRLRRQHATKVGYDTVGLYRWSENFG